MFNFDEAGPWIEKDPDASLDYEFDWSAWLGEDNISSAVVQVSDGLTLGSNSSTNTKVTVWLSGGSKGKTYTVTCRILTTGGRTDDRSFRVKVMER